MAPNKDALLNEVERIRLTNDELCDILTLTKYRWHLLDRAEGLVN